MTNAFSYTYTLRKPMLNRDGKPLALADLIKDDESPVKYALPLYDIYSVSESEKLYNDCLNYFYNHVELAEQFLVYGIECGSRYSDGRIYIDMTVGQSYDYYEKANAEG